MRNRQAKNALLPSFVERLLSSDPDYGVWAALSRARDAVLRVRGLELAGFGLSPIETLVLFLVFDAHESPTPADLSRLMLREHNSVSGLLRRMEHKGLLKRHRDANKRNLWRVELTAGGREACLKAMKIDVLHTVMSEVSQSEKQTLCACLNKISDNALALSASRITSTPGGELSFEGQEEARLQEMP
jgi:DNA-binding MarR family transcriptional regulator